MTVLDIGAGYGLFASEISSCVNETVVTELAREKRQYIKSHTDVIALEDTSQVIDRFEDGHFDVITLFHVLEHFAEPVEQLRKIRRLLTDEGMLVIEVPNHADWLPQISDAYFNFYYQPAHIYYFTVSSLADVLNKAGFGSEIDYVQRYGFENARHWVKHGEPQINEPNMVADDSADELDTAYATILQELGMSDTLWCQAFKK